MIGPLLGPLANLTGALISLALVFAALVALVIALDHPLVKRRLRQVAWFRRFEQLPPSELRFRGMASLGLGVCSFGALLTLKLIFPETSLATALAFGIFTVVSVTLGAALLERAAHLDGWR